MSLINTEIKPFKATAYHNGKFVPVTHEDLKGKWSVVVFYPADFTFVCPTELGDLADHYAAFKKLGVEIYGISTDTHLPTRPGTIRPTPSRACSIRWSATRRSRCRATSVC